MKKAIVALGTVMGSLMAWVSVAAAQTVSPLDGVTSQVNDGKDEFTTFVTSTGLPVLFGLLILGIGIRLGVKYLKRGARAV
jgi:hypothetical protein